MHDVKDVDRVFQTCCVLHNMILHKDGLDTPWTHGIACDENVIQSDAAEDDARASKIPKTADDDDNVAHMEEWAEIAAEAVAPVELLPPEVDDDFWNFRSKLAAHVRYLKRHKLLVWPSRTGRRAD